MPIYRDAATAETVIVGPKGRELRFAEQGGVVQLANASAPASAGELVLAFDTVGVTPITPEENNIIFGEVWATDKPVDGDTCSVRGITYTWRDTPTLTNDVQIPLDTDMFTVPVNLAAKVTEVDGDNVVAAASFSEVIFKTVGYGAAYNLTLLLASNVTNSSIGTPTPAAGVDPTFTINGTVYTFVGGAVRGSEPTDVLLNGTYPNYDLDCADWAAVITAVDTEVTVSAPSVQKLVFVGDVSWAPSSELAGFVLNPGAMVLGAGPGTSFAIGNVKELNYYEDYSNNQFNGLELLRHDEVVLSAIVDAGTMSGSNANLTSLIPCPNSGSAFLRAVGCYELNADSAISGWTISGNQIGDRPGLGSLPGGSFVLAFGDDVVAAANEAGFISGEYIRLVSDFSPGGEGRWLFFFLVERYWSPAVEGGYP
jgi:hypothetical protein